MAALESPAKELWVATVQPKLDLGVQERIPLVAPETDLLDLAETLLASCILTLPCREFRQDLFLNEGSLAQMLLNLSLFLSQNQRPLLLVRWEMVFHLPHHNLPPALSP